MLSIVGRTTTKTKHRDRTRNQQARNAGGL